MSQERSVEGVLDTGSSPASSQAVTWIEPVPLAYRRRRGAFALGIAAIVAAGLAFALWRRGSFDSPELLWILVSLAIGAWRWRYWSQLETVRRFQTERVTLSLGQRVRNAVVFWLLGFGGAAAILAAAFAQDRFEESLLATLPFLLLGLVGVGIFFLKRHDERLSPEAVKLKAHYEALDKDAEVSGDQTVEALLAGLKALFRPAWVRYPLAIAVLWFVIDNAQTSDRKGTWMVTAGGVLAAMWLARELSKWLIWLAVVGAVFAALVSGLSALPVSAAIIIGALIIASAMK
ncbi:MAG: hypothetical protein E6Q93_26225 [Burkholderiaceae bacterium]|nr:MAG: hypothetical protein E6Q93_26225 [Burkholderiaceae bacterium]